MSQGHGGLGSEPYPWFSFLQFLFRLSAGACHYIEPHFLATTEGSSWEAFPSGF